MSAPGATQPEAMPDQAGPQSVPDGASGAPALADAPAITESRPATTESLTSAPAAVASQPDAVIPAQQEYLAAGEHGEHSPDSELSADGEDSVAGEHSADSGHSADGEHVERERGQGQEREQGRPVSKLAVAALVCGLLALVPLALGFGIAALIQIRRTGRRGARLAQGGIYAAWIWVLIAAAAGGLYWLTHGFRPQVHTQYRPAASYGLQVGECFNASQNASGFTLAGCGSPHESEVYGRFKLAGSAYPGAAAVRQEAAQGCAPLLQAYANPSLANIGYDLVYVYPDRPAWAASERTVICEAHFTNGMISGSIRNTG